MVWNVSIFCLVFLFSSIKSRSKLAMSSVQTVVCERYVSSTSLPSRSAPLKFYLLWSLLIFGTVHATLTPQDNVWGLRLFFASSYSYNSIEDSECAFTESREEGQMVLRKSFLLVDANARSRVDESRKTTWAEGPVLRNIIKNCEGRWTTAERSSFSPFCVRKRPSGCSPWASSPSISFTGSPSSSLSISLWGSWTSKSKRSVPTFWRTSQGRSDSLHREEPW